MTDWEVSVLVSGLDLIPVWLIGSDKAAVRLVYSDFPLLLLVSSKLYRLRTAVGFIHFHLCIVPYLLILRPIRRKEPCLSLHTIRKGLSIFLCY